MPTFKHQGKQVSVFRFNQLTEEEQYDCLEEGREKRKLRAEQERLARVFEDFDPETGDTVPVPGKPTGRGYNRRYYDRGGNCDFLGCSRKGQLTSEPYPIPGGRNGRCPGLPPLYQCG